MSTRIYCLLTLALVTLLAACVKQMAPVPPETTTYQERVGDSYYSSGNFEKALQEYDKGLEAGADKSSIYYRKGFAYFSMDQWDKALENFNLAIKEDPSLSIAYEGAGMAAFQCGKIDEAAQYFEKTKELSPKHWVPYAFLAAIYHVRGKMDIAKEYHDKALRLGGKEQEPLVVATLRDAHAWAVKRTPAVAKPQDKQSAVPLEQTQAAAAPTEPEAVATPLKEEEVAAKLDALAEKQRQEEEAKQSALKKSAAPPQPSSAATKQEPEAPQIKPAPQSKKAAAVPAAPPVRQADATPRPVPGAANDADATTIEAEPLLPEPTAAPVPPTKTGPYAILESSFQRQSQAEHRVAELRKHGLAAYSASANLGSRGIWYRVLFGPFDTITAAREAKTRLLGQHGINDLVILKQK